MTKEELDRQTVAVAAAIRRLKEALRDLRPPPHLDQPEINAREEDLRQLLKAYEEYERKLHALSFAPSVPRLK
jgi:hypothetical protein